MTHLLECLYIGASYYAALLLACLITGSIVGLAILLHDIDRERRDWPAARVWRHRN